MSVADERKITYLKTFMEEQLKTFSEPLVMFIHLPLCYPVEKSQVLANTFLEKLREKSGGCYLQQYNEYTTHFDCSVIFLVEKARYEQFDDGEETQLLNYWHTLRTTNDIDDELTEDIIYYPLPFTNQFELLKKVRVALLRTDADWTKEVVRGINIMGDTLNKVQVINVQHDKPLSYYEVMGYFNLFASLANTYAILVKTSPYTFNIILLSTGKIDYSGIFIRYWHSFMCCVQLVDTRETPCNTTFVNTIHNGQYCDTQLDELITNITLNLFK